MPQPLSRSVASTAAPIYNSLSSTDLSVTQASDPSQFVTIDAVSLSKYTNDIAVQITEQRKQFKPAIEIVDLERFIADITIETAAQGAGFLTLSIIDPGWTLLAEQSNGTSFIDVDDNGYIWPPIEVTFPPDNPNSVWRICQVKPSTDLGQANITLVFEDRSVAELREHDNTTDSSLATSNQNETRAEYIKRCIDTASSHLLGPNEKPVTLKVLLPGSAFTSADLSVNEITTAGGAGTPQTQLGNHPAKTGGSSGGDPYARIKGSKNPNLNPFAPMPRISISDGSNPLDPATGPIPTASTIDGFAGANSQSQNYNQGYSDGYSAGQQNLSVSTPGTVGFGQRVTPPDPAMAALPGYLDGYRAGYNAATNPLGVVTGGLF